MKRLIAIAMMTLAIACGDSSGEPSSADAGVPNGITRGVQGTGPADAGGVWALGLPCSASSFSQCPFPEMYGTCYKSSGSPRPFCGVPGEVSPDGMSWVCPAGADAGTAVSVPMCLKLASGAGDCPSFTNFLSGFCIPY